MPKIGTALVEPIFAGSGVLTPWTKFTEADFSFSLFAQNVIKSSFPLRTKALNVSRFLAVVTHSFRMGVARVVVIVAVSSSSSAVSYTISFVVLSL